MNERIQASFDEARERLVNATPQNETNAACFTQSTD